MSHFTAVIVGGGPGGSAAAYSLVRHGVPPGEILLLEKKVFPRTKPCGGAVSQRTLRVWDFLSQVDHGRPLRAALASHLADAVPARGVRFQRNGRDLTGSCSTTPPASPARGSP